MSPTITTRSHRLFDVHRQYYVTYRGFSVAPPAFIGRIHPPRRRKANHSLTPFSQWTSHYMSSFTTEVPYIPSLQNTNSNTMTSHKDPLVWIDCEMTGLDSDTDEIIEIFCLITNGDLEVTHDEGWGTVVHQTQERMDAMDEWCRNTHGKTGLTKAVVESTMTAEQAAEDLLAYIQKHVTEPRTALLAGNSVHADKAFLSKGPYRKVLEFLHYRILDVSSIKEAAKRWAPDVVAKAPAKKGLHEARLDILESIEEARYYREAFFKPAQDASAKA
ncbi:ribonuclease H-like domain-containing protein [Coniochaeta sp. 2T2.1]|nr:ribonuclease H-like domain-containing protein [Coniochaeta sp. 2T2.1]